MKPTKKTRAADMLLSEQANKPGINRQKPESKEK